MKTSREAMQDYGPEEPLEIIGYCSKCLKRLKNYNLDEIQTIALCACCDKDKDNCTHV